MVNEKIAHNNNNENVSNDRISMSQTNHQLSRKKKL